MGRLLLLSFSIFLNVTAKSENNIPFLDSLLALADHDLAKADYQTAMQHAEGALLYCQEKAPNQVAQLAECYHLLGNIAMEQGRYEPALHYFETEEATAIVLKEKNPLPLAKAHNDLGNYYMELRYFDQALTFYQSAFEIRTQIYKTDHSELADSYSNFGNYYLAIGHYTQALDRYQKGLDIRQRLFSPAHLDIASSFANLGDAHFYKKNFDLSLSFLNKSLAIRQAALPKDHPLIGKSLLQLGRHYQTQGALEKAAAFYSEAEAIFRKRPDRKKDMANWYTSVGNSLEEEGRFAKALLLYDSAYQLRSELFENHSAIGESLNDMGNCYASMGDFGNALYAYQLALSIIEKNPYRDQLYIAALYENLGISARHRRQLDESLVYLEKALAIKSTALGEKAPELATTLINLGNAFIDMQNYDAAENYYLNALQITQQAFGQDHFSTLLPINNLGIYFFNQEKYPEALYYFQAAFTIAKTNYAPRSPGLAVYFKNLSAAYARLGDFKEALAAADQGLSLFQQENDPVEIPATYLSLLNAKASSLLSLSAQQPDTVQLAYDTYKKATQYLDATRLIYQDEFSRQNLVASNFEIYEGALHCLFYLIEHQPSATFLLEEAFELFEKSKSLTLLDALLRSKALNFSDMPAELKTGEDLILSKINYWEKKRYDWLNNVEKESSQDELIQLNQQIEYWKGEHRSLMEKVKQYSNRYYQLKYEQELANPQMIQQRLLTKDKALIEYFIGQKDIYIFLLAKDKKRFFKVAYDFPLEKWMANLREAISAFPIAGTTSANIYLDVFAHFSHQLFEKIFQPLLSETLPHQLIIVPDGALAYLPFEVLLETIPADLHQFKSYTYLIKKHQISYSFSATFLHQISSAKRTHSAKKFLGIAPSFSPDSPFEQLAFNQKEVDRIGELMRPSDCFKFATVAQFREMAPHYNMLHLATHGVLNDKADAFSFIALSPDTALQDQGLLFTRDLYDMRLQAAMVVLSACETGLGKYQRGEGIISLARGFAYAGAKSTLTTLWSIDDETTGQLMYQFYTHIKRHLPKDEALHLAKIEFLEAQSNIKAHPFYWAPFVLIGDTSPIGGGNNWLFYVLAGLGGVLLLWWFWSRRKKALS
ncbi:MAG: tetratricopeptide repeat protein [Saprospiraceae bacterium]